MVIKKYGKRALIQISKKKKTWLDYSLKNTVLELAWTMILF